MIVNLVNSLVTRRWIGLASDELDTLFPGIFAVVNLSGGFPFGLNPREGLHVDELDSPLCSALPTLLNA